MAPCADHIGRLHILHLMKVSFRHVQSWSSRSSFLDKHTEAGEEEPPSGINFIGNENCILSGASYCQRLVIVTCSVCILLKPRMQDVNTIIFSSDMSKILNLLQTFAFIKLALNWECQHCFRTRIWKRCWTDKSKSGPRLVKTHRRKRKWTRCSERRTNSPNKTEKRRRRSVHKKVNAKDKSEAPGHFVWEDILLQDKNDKHTLPRFLQNLISTFTMFPCFNQTLHVTTVHV